MWGGPGDIPLPSVFSHGGGRVLAAHRCRVLHGIWCLAGHAVGPCGKTWTGWRPRLCFCVRRVLARPALETRQPALTGGRDKIGTHTNSSFGPASGQVGLIYRTGWVPTREKTRTASVTSVTRACDTGASTTPLGHYSVETLLRRGAGKGVDGGRPVSKNLEAVWVRGGWGGWGHGPMEPRPGVICRIPGGGVHLPPCRANSAGGVQRLVVNCLSGVLARGCC